MKKIFTTFVISSLVLSCSTNSDLSKITEENVSIQSQPNEMEMKREVISRTLGDAPNFAQTSNGNFSAVISRDYGRGAKAGAIIEFLYPSYARDHLWDAYNGVHYDGKLTWLHEMKMTKQSMKEDSGIIITKFTSKDNKLEIQTQDVALQGNDTLVRNLKITNKSSTEIKDLKTFFYEFLTVNYLGSGDKLEYDYNSKTLVHSGQNVSFNIGSDIEPEQFQCGGSMNLITNAYDARKDAEDGDLKGNDKVSGGIGLGVNGNLGHSFNIKPNQTISVNYYMSVGKNELESFTNFQKAKLVNWETAEKADINYWKNWLAKGKKPNNGETNLNRVYRRSLITMKQNTANNGAIIASPTLMTPVYAFTWPRDGCVSASAYLTAGYKEEARKFLDFIVQMQKPNGGWAVNFFMDGSRHLWDFGDDKNEHDQVGTVPWTIYEYYLETKDVNWLRGKWSYIKKAGDFLIQFKDKNDLMTPCRDLWELHTDKSWTFTNAAAYAGLRAAYETGKILGESDIEKYQIEADKIKNAINDKLWDENGKYFVRGLRNSDKVYDKTVEAANLGLGYPFHVFDYKDEKMQMMADKIYNTLSSPKKGIRRYTNDKYYDGQPWPATTDWLAIQYAKSGNKQRAMELHNAITGYALSTESLLLGEQFDEQKNLWVSAVPLTWSASKYVLASLEIY